MCRGPVRSDCQGMLEGGCCLNPERGRNRDREVADWSGSFSGRSEEDPGGGKDHEALHSALTTTSSNH